jgi:transcriptional regulator with XRE-family HTH domain
MVTMSMDGKQLMKLRKLAGLSQTKLAKEINISVRTISRYETGELPVPKAVELALRYLVSVEKKEG